MKISWWQLFKAAPKIQDAVLPIGTKDWSSSKTIWYNLIASIITILAACGIYFTISDDELQAIGAGLAVAVPAIVKLVDAAANIWLRFRTGKAIAGTKEAKKLEIEN